jgi:hypothetical protein
MNAYCNDIIGVAPCWPSVVALDPGVVSHCGAYPAECTQMMQSPNWSRMFSFGRKQHPHPMRAAKRIPNHRAVVI